MATRTSEGLDLRRNRVGTYTFLGTTTVGDMPIRYSVNELVDQDREVRTHWIWDEELPRGDQLDENGKCIVCDLPHPNTPRLWVISKQSGQSKMIEERHEGHEFVVKQNHGSYRHPAV